MAEIHRVRRSIKQLQLIKTWQLVILLVLVSVVAATFLRLNNIGMVERRDAVLAADEAGDEQATIQRLYDLQRYVSSHMNTDLSSGVPLQASYDRDVQTALAQAASDANPHGNIFKAAQAVCAPRFSSYSSAYLQCVTSELSKYPSSEDAIRTAQLPIAESYVHNFTSPIWSPDFAGFSTLVVMALGIIIVIRFASLVTLRVILRRHYKEFHS